jgi:hypothetical protein
MTYDFDRFLRYDEMATWLRTLAAAHPTLLSVESYGTSHQGRDLLVATITDTRQGEHHTKPAHWIDANIHAVEVTGGVAALYIIHDLVHKFVAGDATVVEALRTRTFYIAPRVNPDGVEDALRERPLFHRSSVRAWPWSDGHRWPGLHPQDIDGDGRILTMRIADNDGGWMQHPQEPRVMIPVGPLGAPAGVQRYRLLAEGLIENFDGFTIDQSQLPRRLGCGCPGVGRSPDERTRGARARTRGEGATERLWVQRVPHCGWIHASTQQQPSRFPIAARGRVHLQEIR